MSVFHSSKWPARPATKEDRARQRAERERDKTGKLSRSYRRIAKLLAVEKDAAVAKRLGVSIAACESVRRDLNIPKEPPRFRGKEITRSGAIELLRRQGNKCGICPTPLTLAQCHIDHDHRDGHVRGILCPSCNFALGWFRDCKRIIALALHYLVSDEARHKGLKCFKWIQKTLLVVPVNGLVWEDVEIPLQSRDAVLWSEALAGRKLLGRERRRALAYAKSIGEDTSNNYELARIFQCDEKGIRQGKEQLLASVSVTDPTNEFMRIVKQAGLTILKDGQPVEEPQLRELVNKTSYPRVSRPRTIRLPAYIDETADAA